jgi:hypothetical protein
MAINVPFKSLAMNSEDPNLNLMEKELDILNIFSDDEDE